MEVNLAGLSTGYRWTIDDYRRLSTIDEQQSMSIDGLSMNDYRPNTVHWTASRTKKQVNGTVNGRWCRQRAQRLNNGRLYLQESATGESWERRGCRPGILMHDDEVHMLILGVYWLGLYWCGGILSRFILRWFDTDVVHTDVVHTEAIHTDWSRILQHMPIRFRFRCNLIRVLLKSSAV